MMKKKINKIIFDFNYFSKERVFLEFKKNLIFF